MRVAIISFSVSGDCDLTGRLPTQRHQNLRAEDLAYVTLVHAPACVPSRGRLSPQPALSQLPRPRQGERKTSKTVSSHASRAPAAGPARLPVSFSTLTSAATRPAQPS